MSILRPGRHGGMSSSELEMFIVRNGEFLTVSRAGSGDGNAGVHNSVNGEYYGGIGGGWLPEYSRHSQPKYNCDCTPGGICQTGSHGIGLIRGWRNIVHELLSKGRIRLTREVMKVMGSEAAHRARDYGQIGAPMSDPNPGWKHSGLNSR